MFSLRQKKDGSFYLTFDPTRRFDNRFRGSWQWVGPQNNAYTDHCVRVNRKQGLLCAPDDEGQVRVLVLEG